MATPSVPFRTREEVSQAITGTVAHLAAGRVVAYPTETVYGLGCAIDDAALERLLQLKERDSGKPFLLLVSNVGMLRGLGLRLEGSAELMAARFWPGPLTLVLSGGGLAPSRLRGLEGGLAVRWTSHPGLGELISAYGAPITSTSANRPGLPPAATATEIVAEWGDAISRGELRVLDGGRLDPSDPSTLVDCTGFRPRLIRRGAITVEQLRETVRDLTSDD